MTAWLTHLYIYIWMKHNDLMWWRHWNDGSWRELSTKGLVSAISGWWTEFWYLYLPWPKIDDALEDCHQFWTVHSRGFISHIITFFSPWHSYPVSWLSALLHLVTMIRCSLMMITTVPRGNDRLGSAIGIYQVAYLQGIATQPGRPSHINSRPPKLKMLPGWITCFQRAIWVIPKTNRELTSERERVHIPTIGKLTYWRGHLHPDSHVFLGGIAHLGAWRPGADKMRQNETNKTFSFMAMWSTVRCGFPAVFSIPHRRRCFLIRSRDGGVWIETYRDSLQGRFGACLEIPKNMVTWNNWSCSSANIFGFGGCPNRFWTRYSRGECQATQVLASEWLAKLGWFGRWVDICHFENWMEKNMIHHFNILVQSFRVNLRFDWLLMVHGCWMGCFFFYFDAPSCIILGRLRALCCGFGLDEPLYCSKSYVKDGHGCVGRWSIPVHHSYTHWCPF